MRFIQLSFFLILPACAFSQEKVMKEKKLARYYYERAEELFQNEDYTSALSYYDSSIFRDPQQIEVIFSRAITKEYLEDYEGAISDYVAVEYLNPDYTEAILSKAILRYQIKQFEFAYEDFKKLQGLEDLSLQTNAIFYGQKVSEGGVSKIGTMENMDATILNYLGLCAEGMENHSRAIQHFNKAITSNPSSSDLYVNRAISYYSVGNKNTAIRDLKTALYYDPDNELAKINLARVEGGKEPKAAIDMYDKVLSNNPEYAEAYAERGIAKLISGDLDGALEDYNSAIELEKKEYMLWLNRGIIKEKLTDFQGAISDLEQSVALHSANDEAYFHLGNIYSKLKVWNKSAYNYTMALNYAPEYKEAYYNRAIAFYYLNQNDKACADLDRAIELGYSLAKSTRDRMCKTP